MVKNVDFRLTALPGRPNRVLPIGVIADGKHKGESRDVHVHTGSTRIVPWYEAGALSRYLEAQGIAGDYQLVPLTRSARRGGHRRGQFAAPARPRASSSSPASSKPKGKAAAKAASAKGSGD